MSIIPPVYVPEALYLYERALSQADAENIELYEQIRKAVAQCQAERLQELFPSKQLPNLAYRNVIIENGDRFLQNLFLTCLLQHRFFDPPEQRPEGYHSFHQTLATLLQREEVISQEAVVFILKSPLPTSEKERLLEYVITKMHSTSSPFLNHVGHLIRKHINASQEHTLSTIVKHIHDLCRSKAPRFSSIHITEPCISLYPKNLKDRKFDQEAP